MHLPFSWAVDGADLPRSWAALANGPVLALLESGRSGRHTYVCDRAARVFLGGEAGAIVWSGDFRGGPERLPGEPLTLLRGILAERRAPVPEGLPEMPGGLIGAFGYDLVRGWERLPPKARRDLELPVYALIEPAELFAYDHHDRTLRIVHWTRVGSDPGSLPGLHDAAREAVAQAWERWRQTGRHGHTVISAAGPRGPAPVLPPSFGEEAFADAVQRVKEYLAAGDTYQVNLSRRESRPTGLAPVAIYDALRRINPSPYMGLLQLPDWALVCGSPELLVRSVGGRLSSRPIAGTRPRAAARDPDEALSAELLASDKERAEHLMLVDLIRNDLGRVAAPGSVSVREFMALERYSHVMHLVSQVEADLAPGRDWADVLRAMFPGGTITGCPKCRTMEIIEELEPVGRGFYTGSLGWISDRGEMEMNIIIRSMLVQGGVAHVQAGAGIVADSAPAQEWDEVRRKAQALWDALAEASARRAGDAVADANLS